MKTNKDVENIINNETRWREEIVKLRSIVIKSELKETIKWKQLCYTYRDKNVAMISGFNDSFVLSFFKGILLKDSNLILEKPGKNSQSDKLIRFRNIKEIEKYKFYILEYIEEAIEIEKNNIKVEYKDITKYDYPKELYDIFKENPELESAFNKLSEGRQKGYLIFFNGAKKSETRRNRIIKYQDRILTGKGINDCICGLSNRMPSCDGSHNKIKHNN